MNSLKVTLFIISVHGLGIADVGAFENRQLNIAQKLIEAQALIYFRQPPFWQYLVMRSC